MTREEADFIGGMNMCDEISNEAYKKIMCHCEVQEPKTGHWIGRFHGFPPEPTTVCSECGFDRDFYIRPIGFDELKFCPNCGAKMQEREG